MFPGRVSCGYGVQPAVLVTRDSDLPNLLGVQALNDTRRKYFEVLRNDVRSVEQRRW